MRITKKHVVGIVLVLSSIALVITSSKLLLHDFPSKQYFSSIYFGYAFAALVCTHSAFFFANLELRDVSGKGLSKNVPRYIDYGVTVLIAAGLVQIYFSEDVFAKYIAHVSGTKAEIVTNIRSKAASHLRDDCKSRDGLQVDICKKLGVERCEQNGGFSVEYCKKLDEIVNAKDLEEYISRTLSKDSEFLDHAIGYVNTSEGPVGVKSPIARYVNQYTALSEYGVAPQDPAPKFAWSWVALILLPLVISLRATKTSLEIFGDLS